jgi:flagellar L-ring protein FlgH
MKMIKRIIIVTMFISALTFAQDMRENSFSSLFSDLKANRIGDAVTIIVVESSQASNNAETSAGRSSDLGFDLSGGSDKAAAIGSAAIGSNNDFKGSGTTKQSGMIKTKISATIDSVLQNGNLLLKGNKKITINGEEQTVSIKGIIRTSDITSDNSVYSYNISEAEIQITGNGLIGDSQQPGWLTKIFHWIF